MSSKKNSQTQEASGGCGLQKWENRHGIQDTENLRFSKIFKSKDVKI